MASTPRDPLAGEGNTFDLVSDQLDRLHDLLRDESDDEEAEPTDYVARVTPRPGGPEEYPSASSSEDITNRLKEALLTLDRLDEAVDAFTVESYENSESESDREQARGTAGTTAGSEWASPGKEVGAGAEAGPEGAAKAEAPPGGIIMDGWLETKSGGAAKGDKVNFKKKWDKRYCVLTTEVIRDDAVFVLACFKTQKAFQKKQGPDVMVQLGHAAVALDIANSSAGSIVISIRSSNEEWTYLRSTVSFVAQGWVTGMRGLQFAELVGWSERDLCTWLRVGGISEETLTMLQAFNLDGLHFASLGSTGPKQQEAAKHLQRNLGLSEGESEAIMRQLGHIQTPDVMTWLEDKDRELDGLYPSITDAVQFWAMQLKVKEEKETKAKESPSKPEAAAAPAPAGSPSGFGGEAREQEQAEVDGFAEAERMARDGARVAQKAKRHSAAVRIQQVWRGVADRQHLSILMEDLGYFDTGELDEQAFHAGWETLRSTRAGVPKWTPEDIAATKIAAAYRGYTRRMSFMMMRVEKHLAAVDIQSAWRGKVVRMIHELELDGKSQAILDRTLIRRRVRLMWQNFFALQEWLRRTKRIKAMSLRGLARRNAEIVSYIFQEWMDLMVTKRFYQKIVDSALEKSDRRFCTSVLAEWSAAASGQRQEREAGESDAQRQQRDEEAELERRKKEQSAAALIRRALSSRDPTLVEEAIESASPFPSLQPRCDDCRHLLNELVVEFVMGALESGDMAVVTKALSLARKYNMGAEVEQLAAWRETLTRVKTLIVKADKTGDLDSIEQAIAAAQAHACFAKQVQALRQMKSLLADVHSLLNQALERQDPEDVNMAIKVASRFDSIRQSEKYKRLADLKKSIEIEQGRVCAGNAAVRGSGAKRKSPKASAAKKRKPFDEDVPPRSNRGERRQPANGTNTHAGANSHSTPGSQPSSPDSNAENSPPAANGTAAAPPSTATASNGSGAPKPPASLRPEVAEMIAHCAEWVAQHGPAFEKTLKAKNASNPAFSFLQQPASLEAKYYRKCLDHERGQRIVNMSKQSAPKKGGPTRIRKDKQAAQAGKGSAVVPGNRRQQQLQAAALADRTGLSPLTRAPSNGPKLVFIWDMDETLIVFQSLVSGSYMNARRMNPERHEIGKNLGLQMMKLILWPLDNAMFFEQIEQVDKHHVKCLDKFDDGADLRKYDFNADRFFVQDGRGGRATCDLKKLAYRYRRIREVFGQRREGAMSPEVLQELKECYAATDKFTAGWLTLARTLLHKVSMIPGAVSVVVSACQLTPTLAKTMIYQLDDFVPAENIYSGSQIGKVRVDSFPAPARQSRSS